MKKVLWLFPVAALAVSTAAVWARKKKPYKRTEPLGI